jgi:hypothetical protein
MGKFKKDENRPPNAGRRRGSINKTTGLLKEAILLAAELEGDISLQDAKNSALLYRESDKEAAKKRGGLLGYLRYIARVHPQSFVGLLNRVLPMQVRVDARSETVYRTVEEIQREMARRGVPMNALAPLLIEGCTLESDSDDKKSAS